MSSIIGDKILTVLVLFAAQVASSETLLSLDWDSLVPGTQVKGITQNAIAGSGVSESRIYVGNAESVSPPNSLVYDFTDWPTKKLRGYSVLYMPAVTNGWTEFSLCFRRESGSVSGELRGYYDLPEQGIKGKKRSWIFLWLTFNEMFSIKVEGQSKWSTIRVGNILPDVWHRVTIVIPPRGAVNAQGRVRLERKDADGYFKEIGVADVPFKKLVLRSLQSFDFTGHGPCKFQFDDFTFRSLDGVSGKNR